jgi:hypothetical protein
LSNCHSDFRKLESKILVIIQKLLDDRLLCIHQTTHAFLAHEFCRHWGNDTFARPEPYAAVMLGIAQHDNGWYEWEKCPRLDEEGHPIDFLHGPTATEKRTLWVLGVDRTYEQHPYAGLLVALHASMLYEDNLATTPDDERDETHEFLCELRALPERVGHFWQDDPIYGPALCEERLLANTHLLKFGDNASLQVCVPWGAEGMLHACPVDGQGKYADIKMSVRGPAAGESDGIIHFDPWPFGISEFGVSVHGRLLEQNSFTDEDAYHGALRSAPLLRLSWRVERAG